MSEPVTGWSVPVYEGLREPLLLWGTPYTFFVVNALVTLSLTMFWYPACVLGTLCWLVVRVGTTYDQDLCPIVVRHLRYRSHYEG